MAIYLEDKLFHTIKAHGVDLSMSSFIDKDRLALEQKLCSDEMYDKLNNILSSGCILSRDELNKRFPSHKFWYCAAHFSGDNDTISLAQHKNVPINYEKVTEKIFGDYSDYYYHSDYGYWIRHFKSWQSEDAFACFVMCGISLVFDNKLLDDCIHGKYGVIEHEVLFKKEIPLDLLVALSIPLWNALLLNPYFLEEEPNEVWFTKEEYIKYEFVKKVLELMKKYNLSVPLVSAETGVEFQENKEFTRKLERTFNKNNE